MKITIAGAGYVGFSLATLLAQHNNVTVIDVDDKKIDLINNNKSPIKDSEIDNFLLNKKLSLKATKDKKKAYCGSDYVVVATPTDYDMETNTFDMRSVESVIKDVILYNKNAVIVIKSTVPIGYIAKTRKKYNLQNIVFSPEFLREGQALYDNLYPSRIVVGEQSARAQKFAEMLMQCAIKKDVPILLTGSTEAEAVKLFANTYLAMRVAYFNELDSFAEHHDLNTGEIIEGVCTDPRIGNYYNNPSFGYGGYCLPKDTKQLRVNYDNVPNNLVSAIIDANSTRKKFIADSILAKKPEVVGIYRLVMKSSSDNFRESAIIDIAKHLSAQGIKVIVYEPALDKDGFYQLKVFKNLSDFKKEASLIVTNRVTPELYDVKYKVYSRDISGKN